MALPLPLSSAPVASDPAVAPVALILRSRTEQLRFLRAIRTELAMTAIVAAGLAMLLSFAVARTITRPLATITDIMREVAATGDLTRKIVLRGDRDDEDARLLATTFNTLTDSIARFQREMSQKERLSSLGRLSTVIAHEVRNPLMIIKAALHTLRQPDAERRRGARSGRRHRRRGRPAEPDRQRRARLRAPDPVRARADRPQRALPRVGGGRRGRARPVGAPRPRSVPADRLDRRRAAAAGAGEPPRERAAGGRGRRARVGAAACSCRHAPADWPRLDPRRRHTAPASPAPDLLARLRPVLHDQARRHRARPADRQEHRRRPRRHDRRHQRRRAAAPRSESICRSTTRPGRGSKRPAPPKPRAPPAAARRPASRSRADAAPRLDPARRRRGEDPQGAQPGAARGGPRGDRDHQLRARRSACWRSGRSTCSSSTT